MHEGASSKLIHECSSFKTVVLYEDKVLIGGNLELWLVDIDIL